MDVAIGYFDEDDMQEDDMSKPPSSGIAYLRRVQKEAKGCPDVVIATYPQGNNLKVAANNFFESVMPGQVDAPKEELQLRIAANFASLRQAFIHYKTQNGPSKCMLPERNDSRGWCLFCFGKSFYQECYKDNRMDLDSPDYESAHPPLLSILQNINQPFAVTLLSFHLQFLEKHGFSVEQGQWLFGLLLCLDKPTPPDTVSLLRELTRKCFKLLDGVVSEENMLASHLTLIIVLVSKYFGQFDLSLNSLS